MNNAPVTFGRGAARSGRWRHRGLRLLAIALAALVAAKLTVGEAIPAVTLTALFAAAYVVLGPQSEDP